MSEPVLPPPLARIKYGRRDKVELHFADGIIMRLPVVEYITGGAGFSDTLLEIKVAGPFSEYVPAARVSARKTEILWPSDVIHEAADGEDARSTSHQNDVLHRRFFRDLFRCEHGTAKNFSCAKCVGGLSLGNPYARGETPLSDLGEPILAYTSIGGQYVMAGDYGAHPNGAVLTVRDPVE